MEKIKLSVLIYCTLAGWFIGFVVGMAVFQQQEPHTDGELQDLSTQYSVDDYNQDYGVDLKQEGFLIVDEDGECYYVPEGQLEEWFLEMNL